MNWKSIIATALVTGVITIVSGMVIFWVQAKTPELTFNSIRSIPFDDEKQTLFIQQVDIMNDGNKPAEDVVLSIKLPKCEINKSKIDIDFAISYKKIEGKNSFKLEIPSLNPGEGAKVSLLVESSNGQMVESAVSLRGKGVKGVALGKNTNTITSVISISLIAAYAGIITFVLSTKTYRERFWFIIRGLLSGKIKAATGGQKYDIASSLAIHGFPGKAKEYLVSPATRQYWAEADLLAAEVIKSSVQVKESMVMVLKDLIEIPNMASTSKAIVAYNISRIYKALDNNTKVREYIKIANELDKKEVELRLSKDPIFQTK